MATLAEKNLARLRKSPLIHEFVVNHNGEWNHADWLGFCGYLEEHGFTPIDLDQVGLLLEDEKARIYHS